MNDNTNTENTENAEGIAAVIASLDATGILAALVEAKGGTLTAAEAREALEELHASDPAAGAAVREAFLSWPPDLQEEALETLAGSSWPARRTWTRLLLGIPADMDGTVGLA